MKAWVLNNVCDLAKEGNPLSLVDLSIPEPGDRQIRIRVLCCGVCHTELDEIEGRTPPDAFPVILGHQVIGLVDKVGSQPSRFKVGDRVGVAWIFMSCGQC